MSPVPADTVSSRLRRIQGALGVTADGVLGPETLSALEARLRIKPPARATSLRCSRLSLDLIVAFEVSSKAAYEKKYQRPIWPGGDSGVTIGIGYDLGVTTKADIERDWSALLADADLASLLAVQGATGPQAEGLAQGIAHVVIPFADAESVFYRRTLPRCGRVTRSTFPGVEGLPPDAQGMMLSLVYNRGSSLDGPRRREMAEIRRLIRQGGADLDAIADQFDSMKRLWPDARGLQERREREGEVVRESNRRYGAGELVRL